MAMTLVLLEIKNEWERQNGKEKNPFVIAYEFDGTLAPSNIQEYNFIPAIMMKPEEFWKEAKMTAQEQQQADEILV